jgi:EAL domain
MASRNIPGERRATERGSTRILATWGIAGVMAAACAVLIGLEVSYILNQRSEILAGSRRGTAHGLGTITTVEGVETEEQFEYMRAAGVDLAQGDLFGRPVPISQLDLNDATFAKAMVA